MTRESLRLVVTAVAALTIAASSAAQTRIELRKNKYTPQQDVELGRQAAAEVRRELPMMNDDRVEDFVEDIGEELIREIPPEFRHPGFEYSFDVVNLKEINAFALPGGPMFVHRGMLAAARTDGEVAGVMAHELSHVILRHGTVQASKGQKFQIGAIAGQILGRIVGGRTGAVIAQGSELGLGTYFLKYGREFEREADLLGAQLMARAGYDPREMASMFETIQKQGGSRGPEWLSSHPNPGNRAAAIHREAEMLRVEGRASSADIEGVHARLAQLPPAPSMAQVQRSGSGSAGSESARRAPVGTSRRAARVEPPSGQWRTYQAGDFLRLSVPANWRALDGGGTVTYAPEGGYFRAENGQSAFTHGVQIGVIQAGGGSLLQKTEQLLEGFARGNPQLRRQGGYSRTSIAGRPGLTARLSNVSEVTGQTEAVNVSTVELRDGGVLFLIGVAPASEARAYSNAFSRVRQSVQLADR
ncbi:MAG TPA: M48 family metallopeptidase [Vicinamibacterales bacterium]|nr:M48 family metallopeptidase [Vicinamibacterales bacterium]